MSQRPSGYVRRPDEDYATVEWPVLALLTALRLAPVGKIWDPCNGAGKLVATLRAHGFDAIGTSTDFFTITSVPAGVSDLITNPPYGSSRRGELAVRFIEHALALGVPRIAMLLRVDFDSAITRQHLFRHCEYFAGKVVLHPGRRPSIQRRSRRARRVRLRGPADTMRERCARRGGICARTKRAGDRVPGRRLQARTDGQIFQRIRRDRAGSAFRFVVRRAARRHSDRQHHSE